MKQTRIRLFGSVLMIIIIPMALYLLGIWKNSDSHLTTQVLTSGIAVLVVVGFSMALWIYSGIIRPLEKLHEAMNEIKEGNLDKVLDAEDVGGEIIAFLASLLPIIECRGGMIIAKIFQINFFKFCEGVR